MTETLATLIADYTVAKAAEDKAVAERRRIAKLIEDMVPGDSEGTSSKVEGDYKVTVTRKVTRKVDTPALQSAWGDLPAPVQEAFKWSADVSLTKLRTLSAEETLAASKFITAKPGASSVEVKEIKVE